MDVIRSICSNQRSDYTALTKRFSQLTAKWTNLVFCRIATEFMDVIRSISSNQRSDYTASTKRFSQSD